MNQANRALFLSYCPRLLPCLIDFRTLYCYPIHHFLISGPRPINRKCVASKPTFIKERMDYFMAERFFSEAEMVSFVSCSHPLYVDISQTTIFFVSQSTIPINAAPLKCFIFGVLLDFDGVFCSENIHYHVVSVHLSAVKYFSGSVEERGACLSSGLEVTRYVSPVVLSLNTSLYSMGTALSTSAE